MSTKLIALMHKQAEEAQAKAEALQNLQAEGTEASKKECGIALDAVLQAVAETAMAEGSELEFNEDKHHYGISASRNVGYGYWQHGVLYTFT